MHPLWEVVYHMVEGCLGTYRQTLSLQWLVADSMIQHEIYLYGAWTDDPRTIVLERAYMYNPTVISHEVIHDLTDGAADPDAFRCQIPTGVPLPVRPVPK